MQVGSTTRPCEVNVRCAYPGQCKERRQPQGGGHEKDVLGGQEVPDDAHHRSRRKATDRGQALIAAESASERVVPNEPKADRGDPRRYDASGHAL